jgi:oligosaccharide repeat unit polymerase
MYLRSFLCLILFIILAFGFPLLIINESHLLISIGVNLFLAGAIILYSSIRLCLLGFRNEQKIMELTFFLFTYIWMGITPFAHILTGKFAWPGVYSDQRITFAYFIILLGLLSYEIGIFLGKRKFKNLSVSEDKFKVNVSSNWLVFITILSLLFTILVLAKTGFSSLFAARLELDTIYSSSYSKTGTLIYSNLQKVPIFVSLVLCIVTWLNKKKLKVKKPPTMLLVFLLVINIIISNPVSNARYWFGSVALAIMFLFVKWGKRTFVSYAILVSVLLLIIFPYSDVFRNNTDINLSSDTLTYQLTQKGDYDAFQQLLNTIIYVTHEGVTYGYQLLGALFFWVPRSIWVDKPYGSGHLVAEHIGYQFTNLSSPLWAESYINFGLIGVFIIFALYGYISYYLQKRYIISRQNNVVSIFQIIVPFLAAYQLFLLRGDLLNGIAYMSAFILFSFLYTTKFNTKKRYKLVW